MEYDLIISLIHSTEKNFKNQQPPKDYVISFRVENKISLISETILNFSD